MNPLYCIKFWTNNKGFCVDWQVENYHEHVKMTSMKTASGKDKKSKREVRGKERFLEFR